MVVSESEREKKLSHARNRTRACNQYSYPMPHPVTHTLATHYSEHQRASFQNSNWYFHRPWQSTNAEMSPSSPTWQCCSLAWWPRLRRRRKPTTWRCGSQDGWWTRDWPGQLARPGTGWLTSVRELEKRGNFLEAPETIKIQLLCNNVMNASPHSNECSLSKPYSDHWAQLMTKYSSEELLQRLLKAKRTLRQSNERTYQGSG